MFRSRYFCEFLTLLSHHISRSLLLSSEHLHNSFLFMPCFIWVSILWLVVLFFFWSKFAHNRIFRSHISARRVAKISLTNESKNYSSMFINSWMNLCSAFIFVRRIFWYEFYLFYSLKNIIKMHFILNANTSRE